MVIAMDPDDIRKKKAQKMDYLRGILVSNPLDKFKLSCSNATSGRINVRIHLTLVHYNKKGG